jgi:outer membrane protein TolC
VSQAKAEADEAVASLQQTKAKVSSDLKTAYENVYYAREARKLSDEIIKRRSDNLRLVELRFESGHENKGSVLLSKANLQQANFDRLQADNVQDVSRAQLAKTIGADDAEGFDVAGEVPVQEPPSEEPNFISLATTTPDHHQAIARESQAEAAVTIARSGFFPSLNLTGTLGRQGTPSEGTRTDRWSVGAGISFPLFGGGKDYYSTQSASASYQAASSTRLDTDRDLLATLRSAFVRYREAVEKLKVDESFLQAARVRADIARNKYNNGLITFDDWDIIENDLISREKNFLTSGRDRVTAEAAWEQAQGKGALP